MQTLSDAARLGMSMRFRVSVDGINLGSWATCAGLSVEFKNKRIAEGGNYEYSVILPDRVEYKTVTLRRAMSAQESAIVQQWLPGAVSFDLNPDQILMSRQSSMGSYGSGSSNSGTPAGSSASIFKKSTPPVLTLSRVTFFGSNTKSRCDQLMDWMSPGGGMLGALAGAALSAATGINLVSRPPKVIFQWGPPSAFLIEANITAVNVTYTRFAADGTPVRAEVTVRLQQQPSLL